MPKVRPTRPPVIAKPRDWKLGDGSVFKKEAYMDIHNHWHRGYYVASITINGKRRSFYCHSEAKAWEKLNSLKVAHVIAPNQSTHAGQTVDQFLGGWLATLKKRPKTLEAYRHAVKNYLAPGFFGVPLKLLSNERVQEFFNDIQRVDGKGPLAASSYHRLRRVLRRALNFA